MGRGTGTVDEEGRQFIVSSISLKIWHVKEYSYQLLSEEEHGHFFSSEGWLSFLDKSAALFCSVLSLLRKQ